ncbi:putative Proteolysis 1 [Hibiscus syriacus]|uniref:Cyclin-dependent kinase inhibitor n=1 Tax=Hibiscus syriacus TaxID=106335 RepID=A0A6A3CUD7_HIBSY|nr:putative Proteolysis 1 [Hibiscus syriacus]
MEKYIRKAKAAMEVAVMDVSQSYFGVRTRAKTLALQHLQKSSTSPATAAISPVPGSGDGSYLQLRSRRLEKPPVVVRHHESKRLKQQGIKEEGCPGSIGKDFGGVEASFGENVLESEARERGTRESTPCNLTRDRESIRTSGSSTTRLTSSTEANQRVHNSMRGHLPTAHEMDEFFSIVEEEQQRQIIEKYNFDPVNDKPLPERYEWEKLNL